VRNISIPRERGREIPGEYEWEEIGQRVEEERALGEPRHFLTHLFPNTLYRVSLSARNAIGDSQPSYIVFRTAPIPGSKWWITILKHYSHINEHITILVYWI